jgi:hypothetical protein
MQVLFEWLVVVRLSGQRERMFGEIDCLDARAP